MTNNLAQNINDSIRTGLIDSNFESTEELRPQLIYNDTHTGNTVLADIEKELNHCKTFWFSVAFITKSGLIVLKETLKELQNKGIKGKILTTDYLSFNEPDALRELLGFSNIQVHVFTKEHFHTKGYMFKNDEKYTFIVGSSNLTQYALKSSKEWNLKITSLEKGELIEKTNSEFQLMWNHAQVLTNEWISEYELQYKENKQAHFVNKVSRIKTYKLKPNKMQIEATKALAILRCEKKDKALLISATGTGKTYLSAFDVRNVKPKKLLFLVHREQILVQAEDSFKDVLGEGIKTGFLSGSKKQIDADYLFSTVNMMSKESIYSQSKPNHFDYIIIDETHRAGAESYQKILNYFRPEFLLGMTATPERTDGFDIYQLFDHNIAYEIRIQQAMEEDMLCPFHYFGISELTINGEDIDDATEFKYLVSEVRVDNIIKKIKFYGYSGDRVKGLIFCSRKEEARELSRLFNERGYKTTALCGEDNQDVRGDAVNRLEQKESEGGLDYIFIVDIFNEGVDLPAINQIVMLRPTQSSIIFIQQLGRGLRKYVDKEYVVVIDFIGNYKNNFMIPIALSGDRSLKKDDMRKCIAVGNRLIPGCSTINFDAISKKRIYDAIDSAKLNDVKLIRDEYNNLKYKLGCVPKIEDFEKFGSIDIIKIFDKFGSYYNFLIKYDKEDYAIRLSPAETEIIEFLSQKLAKGKRIHEMEMLNCLIWHKAGIKQIFRNSLKTGYAIDLTEAEEKSTVDNLTNSFAKNEDQKKFSNCVFLNKANNDYIISSNFAEYLKNQNFSIMVQEIIQYSIRRYKKIYSNRYKNTNFKLYEKYTYEDVCRLLNWNKNMNAQNIGGYFYDKNTKSMPVFINYVKEEGSIGYEDRFLSPSTLIALSKHPRKVTSSDAIHIYNAKEEGNKIYLFVRKLKNDKESKEFYFLGEIEAIGDPQKIIMKDTKDNAFEIKYHLDTQVREDVYDYLLS